MEDSLPLSPSGFVGRERELAGLGDRLKAARQGQGGVVLVPGEPGIGKTRLLAELMEAARRDGWLVLRGRAYEPEGMPPYLPFAEALREYLRACPAGELAARLGERAADLAAVLPEVSRLPASRPSRATAGSALLDAPALQDRYRVFEAVCDFLAAVAGAYPSSPTLLPQGEKGEDHLLSPLAGERPGVRGDTRAAGDTQATPPAPLLLVLDDLHWADTPSLLLLQHLGRRLTGLPLLVAGAYRSGEVDRAHPLTTLLAALRREGVLELLPLTALSAAECTAFIETASGHTPAAAVAEALYRATSGSPLFLGELVRHLQAEGRDLGDPAASVEDWQVPHGLRTVIDARLGRMSEEANQLLQAAAVLGDGARFDVLGHVCGIEPLPLLDALDQALAAGLLREEGEAYGFSHALVRQAILDELSLPRRQRLHLLAAQALETLYARDLTPHLPALALHYGLAGPSAAERALSYARRAGEAAMAVYAWEEAVRHWQAALALLGPAEAAQRCELLLAVGEAQQRAADAAARDTFRQAAELARGLRSGELLAGAALGYAGAWVLFGRSDTLTVALLEEALAALGNDDSALRCRLLARLAMELSYTEATARCQALSEEAVERARRVGEATPLAYALHTRHHLLGGPEWLEERLAIATELVSAAEDAGDKELLALGHNWRMRDLLELGELAAADRELAAYVALAGELRQPYLVWRASVWRAMRALLAGRFDEAERLALQARELGRQMQNPDARRAYGAQRQVLRRQRGLQNERDLVATQVLVRQNPASPTFRWWLAQSALDLGQRAEAQEQLDHFAAQQFADVPRDARWLVGLAMLAEVCAGLGDRAHASILYELLRPFAARVIVSAGATVCLGSVAYYLALLATTLERWDEAEAHFQAAEAMHERLGARPFLAQTWFEHARMLLARGVRSDRERAARLVAQARSLAAELGMARLAGAASELSLSSTLSRRAGGKSETVLSQLLPDGLTSREAEILCLIASGLTSKQIAAELVLAVHTVRRHTTNLYTKIGAHGRADATAYALRHGLTAERST